MNNWLALTEARSGDIILVNFNQVYLVKPVKDKAQCLLYFSAESSSQSQVMTVASSMSTIQSMIAGRKR